MVWNGFCAMKEHSKMIFLLTSFFLPCSIGGRNIQKFQIFEKTPKNFRSPRMVWNGFCAMKEHSKMIFLLTSFFLPCSIGGRNIQKFQIFEKKTPKIFRSPRMVWNGFCAKKKHSKVIYVDFILFKQAGPNNSVS